MAKQEINLRTSVYYFAVTAITLIAGFLISQTSTLNAVIVALALIIGIAAFLSSEIALYILIASMLLSPQFGIGDVGGETVRGRGITLRLDDILLVVIGMAWFFKTAIQKELGLFLRTPLNRPIACYFIACLVATLFGFMMGRVKGGAGFFFVLKYFEYFVIYLIAVNYLKTREQIERFTSAILVVCFVVCLIAMYQIPGGVRVSAPFEGPQGEPNTLGGYLVLILSVVLGLLLSGYGKARHKIFLWVLLFCILITLAATYSRSSWLSLVPMAISFLYFSPRKLLITICLSFLILIGPFVVPQAVKDRALFTFTQPAERGQIRIGGVRIDTSTSARLESWKEVLTKDFADHPILGFGVTGYRFLDAQYARVLAETGIVGFIAFAVLLWSLFKNASRSYRHTKDPLFNGLSLGFLCGFIGLLTHAIGANTFIIVRIMEPFWFLAAMVVMIPKIESGALLEAVPGKSNPLFNTGIEAVEK